MQPPANKWIIAASVTFGALMGAVDTSIMNVAIPHLRGVFSATTEEISWVSTAYLLSAAVMMPLTAWLGRGLGRKRVCLGGLALFIVGSVACGLAPTVPALVAARVLQGVGAGVLIPIEQAILRETFPPQEQGLAMGLYGVTIMLGPALGPVLGGYMIDELTWSWAFYVNVPVGLVGYAMVSRFVHDPPHLVRTREPVDLAGVATLVLGLAALHVLLEQGERLDWFAARINVVLLLVAVGALAMFVAHEVATPRPAVDLRVLLGAPFASAVLIGGVVGFVVFATLFLLPLFMQDVLHYSPTQAGLMLMPRALVMLVAFPVIGALYRRVPPRLLIGAGLVLGAQSALLMSRFDADTGRAELVLPQVLQGLGLACILTPLSTLALLSVRREQVAAGAGLNNLVRQLGGSLGVAVIATLLVRFDAQTRASLVHNLVEGDLRLQQRVANVTEWFWSRGGVDATTAARQALDRLDGRLSEQVYVLAFERAFSWMFVLFMVLLPLLLVLREPGRPKAE